MSNERELELIRRERTLKLEEIATLEEQITLCRGTLKELDKKEAEIIGLNTNPSPTGERGRPQGSGRHQLAVLEVISCEDGLKATQIWKRLPQMAHASQVHGVVKSLENQEMISKKPSGGRGMTIHITQKGKEHLEAIKSPASS